MELERAYKYHGLGNDFVVLDRRRSGRDISSDDARALCDRHRGVGADGVLVVLPSATGAARMVVHNADGSVAEMCGNGLRCVAKFLGDERPDGPTGLVVETGAGLKSCELVRGEDGRVREVEVEMGPGAFVAPGLLPEGAGPDGAFVDEDVGLGLSGTAVSFGNPHLVLFDVPLVRAAEVGPALERSTLFPERTNVELCALDGPGRLRVVVWERGSGLTQACGTGACAAVAAAIRLGKVSAGTWVRVELPGGALRIRAGADLRSVSMVGPAVHVFDAVLDMLPTGS